MKRKVTRIILHHSAGETMNGAVATMQSQGLHYHRLIDKDGTIFKMRDYDLMAYHAGPRGNEGSIGICLIGNFYQTGRKPSTQQYNTLLSLITEIEGLYGEQEILNHYETAGTVCPGFNMVEVVKANILDINRGKNEYDLQIEQAIAHGIIDEYLAIDFTPADNRILQALNAFSREIDRRIDEAKIKKNPETGAK